MSVDPKHPHVIPTPAALEQAVEDRALDEALEDAAREIADSLRRDEVQQRQQKIVYSWIPITVVGLVAVIIGFSLPKNLRDSSTHLKPVPPQTQEQASKPPVVLQQRMSHTLRLPRGFEWQVDLIDMGNGKVQLKSDRNLNCLGLYRLDGNRLEMYKPVDKRLTEFVWEKIGEGSYVLIEQPPAAKTGANYLGATLQSNARH